MNCGARTGRQQVQPESTVTALHMNRHEPGKPTCDVIAAMEHLRNRENGPIVWK